MPPYTILAVAICAEVAGSAFLKASDGMTRLAPTLAMLALYTVSFFLLAQTLRVIPLGVAYAAWSGVGIVLTATIGLLVFRQSLDPPALLGIAMIVGGVIVMSAFSQTGSH